VKTWYDLLSLPDEETITDRPSGLRFIPHSAFRILHSRPGLILGIITLLAGVIRFTRLAHPCLWYDESMVFWRTCGSYGQLLDCLRDDGFVPLHYSFVWVITRFVRPTPFVLRFVPALSGTLMVPAVYFLARQMLSRRTSLLAAAFTACSAFMLFYSRDAKMYMDAWLFVALNTACLLWWFRTQKSTAWLCWIASGCAACGLQITSAIPVAVSMLLLLTQSKVRWQGVLLWVLGVFVILSGPAGYYGKFNVWKDRVDENRNDNSGLHWIGAYNYGRTGPQLVRCLGTSTLMGWEWPKDADVPNISPSRIDWPARGAEVLLGIFVLACLPWPSRWHSKPVLRKSSEPTGLAKDHSPEPQWRVALWLSMLIVLPVYGFYCRSMPGFATPLDWWQSASQACPALLLPVQHHLLWIPIAMILAALIMLAITFPQTRPALSRGVGLILVISTVLALCQSIAIVCTIASKSAAEAGKPWESLWVPRYIGFIWPTLAVAIAALIMRLPTWPMRTIAIVFLLGVNLSVAGFRIIGDTEPPVDRMAADYVDAENPSHHTLAWMNLKSGMQSPGSGNLCSGPGEYYIDLLNGKKTMPKEFNLAIGHRESDTRMFPAPWYMNLPADVDRVVIWNQYDIHPLFTSRDLPPPAGWKLQSEQWFEARDCWIWQNLAKYRRQEYQRQSP